MSRRTQDLPPLTGLSHRVREWRYNEFFRQAIGLALVPVFAGFSDPLPNSFAVGATLALAGMLFRFYASGFIVKNQKLATDGPYSLVRHPLYTGNLLMIIGFTFASGQWWAIVVSAGFWFFYYPAAIEYEDRKLRGIFGDDWETWSADVPAVIPNGLRIRSGGHWSFRTSWKENYELIIVIYTLLCLAYIANQLG
ncbi:MAG: isoprenylcysteine carboxylmethyltransferase family protein [Gammaproteobacteria bacterium]|nr:MAG: isoprenylcysteine carboxylmethyltransferase family protein [Gammaproteobacteria bacterium]